jgi:hypothetical protein
MKNKIKMRLWAPYKLLRTLYDLSNLNFSNNIGLVTMLQMVVNFNSTKGKVLNITTKAINRMGWMCESNLQKFGINENFNCWRNFAKKPIFFYKIRINPKPKKRHKIRIDFGLIYISIVQNHPRPAPPQKRSPLSTLTRELLIWGDTDKAEVRKRGGIGVHNLSHTPKIS